MKGLILNNSILNAFGIAALNSRFTIMRNIALVFLLLTSLVLHSADYLAHKLFYKHL
ncbi:MAG: hypothetical protein H6627_00465 [Calditrichae bacterium]|nr:hypothetical protein [Calditrichota bacterium]MCB9057009.1 hypothetical protein [Calditrichia bacterium]